MRIAAVASALPEHRYHQSLITAALKHHWQDRLEKPAPGTLGLLLALGPGFCSELLLVRW